VCKREKTSMTRGDCASCDEGTALREPIETKYSNF
jgi:hypothetical protein